jgi:hypothetical protein
VRTRTIYTQAIIELSMSMERWDLSLALSDGPVTASCKSATRHKMSRVEIPTRGHTCGDGRIDGEGFKAV